METRGVRNHNPGNIERGTVEWVGMSADQSADPRFIVFDAPEYGIRAIARILMTYYRRHGLNTVRAIVSRWAPPSENDTGAYAAHVAKRLGVAADAAVDVMNRQILRSLVNGIIAHENAGYVYPAEMIDKGVDLALKPGG